MNQSKFSLADVLTLLASIGFGFVCFLGANFLSIDTEKVWGMSRITGCIVIASVCAGLLFITAFGAALLKRTTGNFKTSFAIEIIFLALFVFFGILFVSKESPFVHYFTVTARKDEIQSKLQASISQAESMFPGYEEYVSNRRALFKSTLIAYNCNPSTIDSKLFSFDNHLLPGDYSDTASQNGTKELATKWLQEARDLTNESWRPIGIVSVVNEIETNSENWLGYLNNLSINPEILPDGSKENFSVFNQSLYYPKLQFPDISTLFTQVETPGFLSLGLAVLAYLLMLISWFVRKRDPRAREVDKIMPYEVKL